MASTVPGPTECTEQGRHKVRRRAESAVELMLLAYAEENHLSDIDMLAVLAGVSRMYLRYVDRDDEERRTGFHHRLAGE